MKIYLHRTQSKGLKVSETGTPHMHYRHTQSHTYFHAHTQCANCITEKPEAEGYKPPTAAWLDCSCELLLLLHFLRHCNRQPSHHQDTGRFSFHPNISTHLRQQTLQTFVFPLSAPQGRDGPVPCDHIPQPASRREQQLDSVMLPCNPVHPSLSLPKE